MILATVVVAGCGVQDTGPIPGLAEADEVPLVEVTPDENPPAFEWSGAYKAGDLPEFKVGRPTAQFMEDAGRDPAEADGLVCFGASGGYGCERALDPRDGQPLVSGANFGGPNVLAWVWSDVPEDTAAVLYADESGSTTWQRPIDRLVILPATVARDGECACRLDAVDRDGETIASVDLLTSSYPEG